MNTRPPPPSTPSGSRIRSRSPWERPPLSKLGIYVYNIYRDKTDRKQNGYVIYYSIYMHSDPVHAYWVRWPSAAYSELSYLNHFGYIYLNWAMQIKRPSPKCKLFTSVRSNKTLQFYWSNSLIYIWRHLCDKQFARRILLDTSVKSDKISFIGELKAMIITFYWALTS